jgi:hypothetical protein
MTTLEIVICSIAVGLMLLMIAIEFWFPRNKK